LPKLNTNKLTEARLKELGYIYDKVERRQGPITIDFLNAIDYLAFLPDKPGVLGIQTTSRSHVGDRLKKVRAEPRIREWLKDENRRIQVWGFERDGSVVVCNVKYDDVCEN
jgi:hypothetical protein